MSVSRVFTKTIYLQLLEQEIRAEFGESYQGLLTRPNESFSVFFDSLSNDQDIVLNKIINDHVPSSALLQNKEAVDRRMLEGFELYRKIFAHIDSNGGVTQIDQFLAVYPQITTFRNLLKDAMPETALRYLVKVLGPMQVFENMDLYKGWVREFAIKNGSSEEILDAVENLEVI